ncbi:putative MFS transporter [Taphrina deformans PYCC 5710]|uniref:MFS transporter n=1 Tax=Taphrina deformans (strain PYCC 5710 / ATCC 11124 / CBS 356.35 / IMI 108563 / JCM 9778 / NBRC 8474) TaxID=1097556 RepID=R4X946_TAPDE|nr:putative MFS transporter [Taphrina deformans PYCC 5710]|eukprot:CCG82226.1 putative MFS transporter [Taphrina deformans PYCC 5710]
MRDEIVQLSDSPTTNSTDSTVRSKSDGPRTDEKCNGERPSGVEELEEEAMAPARVPPDGGYGWVVVGCQTTINAMTWGVNASYAVYLSHFTAAGSPYFPGTTTVQYSFVGGVSVGFALFACPLATLLNARFGHRTPMLAGCLLELASFLCASFATRFWHLFLAQGVLFGLSMGLLFAPSVGIPSQWFSRRRALATGICAGGSGIGGILFNLGTNAMIEHISLQWAYRITAIVVFVSNLAATLLTREFAPAERGSLNPQVVRRSLFDTRMFRHGGYSYILGWGFVSLLAYVTLQFSISKYAVAALGLSQQQASVLAALLSAGMAVGRPMTGFVADRYGRINSAIVFTVVAGILCLGLWLPAGSYGVMVAFAITVGLVAGTFWSLVVPVTAEVVGMADLSAGASIVWLIVAVPCTFATTIALEIVGSSGQYGRLIGFAGGSYLLAGIILLGAKARKQQADGVGMWVVMRKT